MIRNLKMLISTTAALAALGAVGVSSGQGAEFHCSVSPCTLTPNPDGTAKNSHHVIIFKQGAVSAATTCNEFTGDATFAGTTTKEITFTGINYDGCNDAGETSQVNMNGCHYLFTSTEEMMHLQCPAGKSITMVTSATGCTFTIGAQTLKGVSYKTVGVTPNREITVSFNISNLAATANDSCTNLKINPGALTGEYTTGNTILTGETDPGKVMADFWFA